MEWFILKGLILKGSPTKKMFIVKAFLKHNTRKLEGWKVGLASEI